jgi:subtilisin family serine protease
MMPRWFAPAALAVLVALATGLAPAAAPAAPRAKQTYLVLFDEAGVAAAGAGAARAATAEVARSHRLEVTNVYETVVRGFAARVPDDALAALRRDPRVARVEPDYPVWATAERLPTGVDRIGADSQVEGRPPTRRGEAVAIVDTGIVADHPDLNVAGGYNCTSPDRRAWEDKNGHGTHVAGIVGAENNGMGVVGVAPGTPLWAVKVLDDRGNGSFSQVLCGLDWTARQGIGIANLSLAGIRPRESSTVCQSSILHQGVCAATEAGVQIVVAAGNEGTDALDVAPARYSRVITVSALADSDGCAGGRGARRWTAPTTRWPTSATTARPSTWRRRGSASGRPGKTVATRCSTAPAWRRRTWRGRSPAAGAGRRSRARRATPTASRRGSSA